MHQLVHETGPIERENTHDPNMHLRIRKYTNTHKSIMITHSRTSTHADRQTDRQTYRQTDRQTDRKTDRQTDRQTDII